MKKLWNRLCKSNDGFSMVELLCIMGILGVLFGLNSLSLAIQPSTEAKKVTYAIDSMFTRTKVGTLAKSGTVYMELQCDTTGKLILKYFEEYTGDEGYTDYIEEEVLTKYGAEVSYSVGGDPIELGKGKSLVFAFDRRSMGFLTLEEAADKAGVATGATGGYCKAIYVSGGNTTYTITIGPTTGTHSTNLK